jgi:glutathione reductase (NADPH)
MPVLFVPSCAIHDRAPKKLFVLGSHIRDEVEDAAGFGWVAGEAAGGTSTSFASYFG